MRVRVELPGQLCRLSGAEAEVIVDLPEGVEPTPAAVLDVLEERWPALRGTIREHATGHRRAYMRWFAAGRDISHDPPDAPLPDRVAAGDEPLRIVGAIAGG